MPNWCSNTLIIDGDREALDDFLARNGKSLDFNDYVPYPLRYEIMDALAKCFGKQGISIIDGFNRGGYEWCIDHWGTKWNVNPDAIFFNDTGHSLVFSLLTAWSPPEGAIKAMSKAFPDLEFTLEFEDEFCNFWGTSVFHDGKIQEAIFNE